MNNSSAARYTSQRLRAEPENMMLSMTQTCTQKSFRNILGPLSLFSCTDMDNVKKREKWREMVQETLRLEKAPVPDRLQESLAEKRKNVPASLSEFCQELRNRITQQSHNFICSEDQENLVSVMMAELSLTWQDLLALPADPLLTLEENKQLRSWTFEEVLYICEQLYLHHLHMLKTLERQSVFSHQVNCSRIASHMAMDLSSLLNAHAIQRRVAMRIKAMRSAVKIKCREQGTLETHTGAHRLDICPHIKPKKHVPSRQQKRTIEEELIEIQEKIGELDLERVYDLMPFQPELIASKADAHCSTASISAKEKEEPLSQSHFTRLKGCNSMPDLHSELELEMPALPARSHSHLVLLPTHLSSNHEKHLNPAEDLKRLLQDTDPVESSILSDSETEIPPLIRALVSRRSSKLKQLTILLQRLEEEEQRKMKRQVEKKKPQHPQADVESVVVSTQDVARIAAARVSDRVLPETINISMYPPVYNHLTGEIETSSVTWLDRNLFVGTEIKEVYKELSKSISEDYLHFDEDPIIEPALSSADLNGLKQNHEKKWMNPSLQMPDPHRISHRERMEIAAGHKRPEDVTSRAYAAWHKWWKTNLSLDDYLTYISNQESDYLSVVFHLYSSDDSDEDEEDEKRKMLHLQREKMKKRREKIDALKKQKEAYKSGFWNVNTVLMGGLWNEPVLDEVEGEEEEINHVSTVKNYTSMPQAEPVEAEQVQVRLERIWNILCLSETQRLDMTIKYSSQEYRDKLEEVTAVWEQAAQLIQQRESVLYQLEKFERVASDPNRFFQHGYLGTSTARMEEAHHREKLKSQIVALDKMLSKTIHHISVNFNDSVTYKGRPYREKMRWDRTEMLYWLQQERRVQALQNVVDGRGSLPAKLPPLNSCHRHYPDIHPNPEEHFSLASETIIQSHKNTQSSVFNEQSCKLLVNKKIF